ncbi:MAG TPA: hypothetical protein VGJ71_13920 [Candidatus Limnocylindrales bacterium]
MRHRFTALASLLLAVVLAIAGCGGASGPPDPYQLLNDSTKATWNPIQINIGMTFKFQGETITLDPKNIAMVVDNASQKFGFHVSIPAASLGIPAGSLGSLGIDGDSIDFDMVYNGDGLFMRSAIMKPTLQMILGPIGRLPRGDLTGWLKLGTKEELAALSALAAAGGTASPPPGAINDVSKKSFEEAGISLTTAAAVEKRNGVDAQHITLAIDTAKLASNPAFSAGAGSGAQAAQAIALVKALSISGDIWVESSTKRILELDTHIAPASDATQGGDVTITAHDPDGSVSLEAPSSSTDVPLGILVSEMMKLVSGGSVS